VADRSALNITLRVASWYAPWCRDYMLRGGDEAFALLMLQCALTIEKTPAK
jgi:hypothetical protein